MFIMSFVRVFVVIMILLFLWHSKPNKRQKNWIFLIRKGKKKAKHENEFKSIVHAPATIYRNHKYLIKSGEYLRNKQFRNERVQPLENKRNNYIRSIPFHSIESLIGLTLVLFIVLFFSFFPLSSLVGRKKLNLNGYDVSNV